MGYNAEEKSILIVDDEADLREILQYDLEDVGYQTFTAPEAHEALKIISENNIDLVISDIRMPGGDGIFLLDSLRKNDFRDPPVILVSGFSDITPAEAFHKGVVHFLPKPLATEILLEYIKLSLLDPMERWKKKSEWIVATRFERSFPSVESAINDNLLLLGKGGIFVHMKKNLPRLNSTCYFKFTFENTQSNLEGIATCKWQRNLLREPHLNGVGLEFRELTDESIVFINKYAKEQKVVPQIPMKAYKPIYTPLKLTSP